MTRIGTSGYLSLTSLQVSYNNKLSKAMIAVIVTGRGVRRDYIEAYKWFNVAAACASDKGVREKAIKYQDAVAKR